MLVSRLRDERRSIVVNMPPPVRLLVATYAAPSKLQLIRVAGPWRRIDAGAVGYVRDVKRDEHGETHVLVTLAEQHGRGWVRVAAHLVQSLS